MKKILDIIKDFLRPTITINSKTYTSKDFVAEKWEEIWKVVDVQFKETDKQFKEMDKRFKKIDRLMKDVNS